MIFDSFKSISGNVSSWFVFVIIIEAVDLLSIGVKLHVCELVVYL